MTARYVLLFPQLRLNFCPNYLHAEVIIIKVMPLSIHIRLQPRLVQGMSRLFFIPSLRIWHFFPQGVSASDYSLPTPTPFAVRKQDRMKHFDPHNTSSGTNHSLWAGSFRCQTFHNKHPLAVFMLVIFRQIQSNPEQFPCPRTDGTSHIAMDVSVSDDCSVLWKHTFLRSEGAAEDATIMAYAV